MISILKLVSCEILRTRYCYTAAGHGVTGDRFGFNKCLEEVSGLYKNSLSAEANENIFGQTI